MQKLWQRLYVISHFQLMHNWGFKFYNSFLLIHRLGKGAAAVMVVLECIEAFKSCSRLEFHIYTFSLVGSFITNLSVFTLKGKDILFKQVNYYKACHATLLTLFKFSIVIDMI